MKKNIKNSVDKNLQKKLLSLTRKFRHTNYDFSKLESNKANIRKQGWSNHRWNKFEEKELLKIEKRVLEKFVAFFDVIEDNYPEYCFITGMYVPPRFKGNLAVKPFKNGEWCYKIDYDRYLNHNVVSDKLFADSMLICIATGLYQSKMVPRTVRPRIPNNIESFVKHVNANPNGFDTYHKNRFLEQPNEFFRWFRGKYFLKPNGNTFPKVSN